MKWALIKGRHINTDQVQVFRWDNGRLYVFFAGDEDPTYYIDPEKKNYHKLCRTVGVRPDEEETCQ